MFGREDILKEQSRRRMQISRSFINVEKDIIKKGENGYDDGDIQGKQQAVKDQITKGFSDTMKKEIEKQRV